MISPALTSSARTASGRDDWQTPPHVLELVRSVAPIALDPCTSESNPTGARTHVWWPNGDGLAFDWASTGGLVYVNPPYSQIRKWLAKCAAESTRGAEIIALVPARTDTRAWHESVTTADAICFWRGRLQFIDAATGKPAQVWSAAKQRFVDAAAPFPSALVYWGWSSERFARVFEGRGMVVTP